MSKVVDIRKKMDKDYMQSNKYKFFRILEEAKADRQLQELKDKEEYRKNMKKIENLRRKIQDSYLF